MAVKPDPKDGFQWYHEGVAILAATFGLLWSTMILTINYVTIPGYEPKQIDPTFPSSIFTLTLGALGVGGIPISLIGSTFTSRISGISL